MFHKQQVTSCQAQVSAWDCRLQVSFATTHITSHLHTYWGYKLSSKLGTLTGYCQFCCSWCLFRNCVHSQTICLYTGCFIMFSVITDIYNKKTTGSTLMEFFTATGKLKKFLTTRDVWCVHHGRHGTRRYDIQVLATHTHASTWVLSACTDTQFQ